MQIYPSMSPLQLGGKQGSAVALGYFDGIHIGHRTVICGAVDWAQAHGAAAALFTFKLPGGSKIKGRRLYSVEEKRRIVAGLGVEHYLVPTFADIMSMTPEQFVRGLVADCRARAFFCGENFTFGARAAGDPALLQKLCHPESKILFRKAPICNTAFASAACGINHNNGIIKLLRAFIGHCQRILLHSTMIFQHFTHMQF